MRADAMDFPGAEALDLDGARRDPGLRDAHAHLVPTGLAARRIPLGGLTLDGIREAVAARTEELPPGRWIEGSGFSRDALRLDRPPRAMDLDDVAPDHPVRLASHDLHALWVNRRALERAGLPPGSPGYLTEDEVREFHDRAGRETFEERVEAVREAERAFLAHGIREVHDHGRLDELAAILHLARAGELHLRVVFSIRDYEFDRYLAHREEVRGVPGLVEIRGQKMFLDGALGSRTAWMLEPYLDADHTGRRARDPRTARERVRRAAEHGLPTFFHAIGDAAVREALDLAESAPGLPHRVEHAQCIHPDDLPRFAALRVAASLQPVHLLLDTPILLAAWGEERARRSFPVRSLLESGATVRFGSDSPVETLDPIPGIRAAVTREARDGSILPGEETVDAPTAVELYRCARGG